MGLHHYCMSSWHTTDQIGVECAYLVPPTIPIPFLLPGAVGVCRVSTLMRLCVVCRCARDNVCGSLCTTTVGRQPSDALPVVRRHT